MELSLCVNMDLFVCSPQFLPSREKVVWFCQLASFCIQVLFICCIKTFSFNSYRGSHWMIRPLYFWMDSPVSDWDCVCCFLVITRWSIRLFALIDAGLDLIDVSNDSTDSSQTDKQQMEQGSDVERFTVTRLIPRLCKLTFVSLQLSRTHSCTHTHTHTKMNWRT